MSMSLSMSNNYCDYCYFLLDLHANDHVCVHAHAVSMPIDMDLNIHVHVYLSEIFRGHLMASRSHVT